MATDIAFEAIRDWLVSFWTFTPIQFDNEPFTPPNRDDVDVAWLSVKLTGSYYAQQSIGSGSPMTDRWDEAGLLLVSVQVATGTGSLLARRHARVLADGLRGLQLLNDLISFGEIGIDQGSVGDDGNWFLMNVSAQWIRIS